MFRYLCNMRSIVAILGSFIYLLTSAGIPIDVHYCQGKVKSFEIFHDIKFGHSCCTHEKKESKNDAKEKGCCDDESYFYLFDTPQQHVQKHIQDKPDYLLALLPNTTTVPNDQSLENTGYTFTDIPPPRNKPLWLLNCSFIFYG